MLKINLTIPNSMKPKQRVNIITRIANFYIDGFRNMTIGRTLWAIIIIKFFILFAVLKLFFFPNIINEKYDNDTDRAQHVRSELLKEKQ